MIYIISISLIIMSILYIIQTKKNYNINKNFKELNLKFKQLENDKKEAFNVDIQLLQEKKESIEKDISNCKTKVDKLQLQIDEKLAANNALRKLRSQELDESIKVEREAKLEALAIEVSAFYNMEKEKAKESLNHFIVEAEKQKELSMQELALIQKELEEYQKKRESINEAIALENSKKEEQIKHQIHLSIQDKEDIKYLLSIEDKINNKQLLRKLIWSEYLQKPFNEMLKRLFLGSPPKNVIYCIENINNHKKYIGKTSAEVSKRWTEHIKTSLEIGTIKSQNIHKALYGHWDEFIFSIITQTEKEKISNDEKYYIKLFESDVYGYNMKSGG